MLPQPDGPKMKMLRCGNEPSARQGPADGAPAATMGQTSPPGERVYCRPHGGSERRGEPWRDRQHQGDAGEAPTDFAATVERLETLVERLESGELSLEGSLEAFEQGVRLTRDAQRRLDEAELKVRTLTEGEGGGVDLEPFSPPAEDDGER